jgi:integrase
MTRKLPKYVQGWVRDGHPHHYFRRAGFPRVRLPGLPWSPEFMAAHAAAMASAAAPIGVSRSKPGSVGAAVAAYLDSTLYFASRAPGTQRLQRMILERLREQHGDLPIASMPQKFIHALLTKKKPHAARNWLKTLRAFCLFVVEQGWVTVNPTSGIKLPAAKSAGIHTWTDAEIAMFEAHHPLGSKARLAMALTLYTAQRRGDVIKMGPQHVRGGTLTLRQQKTGKPLILPIRPRVAAGPRCHSVRAPDLPHHQERDTLSPR